ncbi:hypothetical protein D3C86_2021950 [compost metagenome]
MTLPRSGPTTGAISAGQVISAIAPTSSDLRAFFRTMIRPTGVINAPPTPCTARAAMNWPRLPDNPQKSDASVKMAIATRKMLRAPKRSPSQPESGMKAAIVSI